MSFEAKLICCDAELIGFGPEFTNAGVKHISYGRNSLTFRRELIFSTRELIFSGAKLIGFKSALNDFKLKPICCKPAPGWVTSALVCAEAKHISYRLKVIYFQPTSVFAGLTCISFSPDLLYVTWALSCSAANRVGYKAEHLRAKQKATYRNTAALFKPSFSRFISTR